MLLYTNSEERFGFSGDDKQMQRAENDCLCWNNVSLFVWLHINPGP